MEDGIIKIHNKEYLTVARRIKDFRDQYPEWSIRTKLVEAADIVRVKATIRNPSGFVVATGHAEEVRGEGDVNRTSCVENTETSAVGRALAFIGFTGTHIASAEEMERALEQQKELAGLDRLKAHNDALRANFESVMSIKAHLINDEYSAAYEAWSELTEDDQKALWMAPSNGGIFLTLERSKMKSNEWSDARKVFYNIEDSE